MRIAIIDNYDSFTYNLVHYVEAFCNQVIVMRNDHINWKIIDSCDKIIFSPGPGLPNEVPAMGEIMERYSKTKAIFGVCLGMQYIAEYYGAQIINLKEIIHGVPKTTIIKDTSDILFTNIPQNFQSGRYHSWAVSNKNIPSCIKVIASDEAGIIMAIRHTKFNLCGVQFHPESIMTEYGKQILKNWLELDPNHTT